jgi:hypothetical protein
MNEERYEHPQIKFMKNIDPNLSSLEQFNLIRSYPWGCEQPQVDVFCELLKTIDHDHPSMIELGSAGVGGSFYSVLFEKWFDKKCTIINNDPRLEILQEIKTYWKNQHLTNAILCHGYVGTPKHYQASPDFEAEKVPRLTVKQMMEDNNIVNLDILHADIQGSEISLCEELVSHNIIKKIRYYFISTHSGENLNTYDLCLNVFNNSMKCKFHFSDPLKGGWGDGLIVVENIEF